MRFIKIILFISTAEMVYSVGNCLSNDIRGISEVHPKTFRNSTSMQKFELKCCRSLAQTLGF